MHWIDAREYLITDSQYGNAQVQMAQTVACCKALAKRDGVIVTQGFIGADEAGNTTTLGFEGSDYSAAVYAAALQAERLILHKDVGGISHADPHWLPRAETMAQLSYDAAQAIAVQGIQILHPKTIVPLQDHKIPLTVQTVDGQRRTVIDVHGSDAWWLLRPNLLAGHVELLCQDGTRVLPVDPNDADAVQQQYQQLRETLCPSP